MNGTPKIQLEVLDRYSRFSSLGPPRRVPRGDHGHGSSPAENLYSNNESLSAKEETEVKGQDVIVEAKTSLSLVDFSEARKRKADRDAPNRRERTLARQDEGSFSPSSRSNQDLGAGVRLRKVVAPAKETFGVEDKENINPYYDYRNHEPKKQIPDRSTDRRRLQNSKILQNAPSSRKVGSLLVKRPAKPTVEPLVSSVSEPTSMCPNDSNEKRWSQQVSAATGSLAESKSGIHQGAGDGDSMSISQPLQSNAFSKCLSSDVPDTDRNNKREHMFPAVQKQVSPLAAMHAETRVNSHSSESNQRGVMLTSVEKMSSSMNSLAIADVHLPALPEKAEAKKASVHLKKSVQGSFLLEGKQCEATVQASSVPVLLVPSANAWSYTLRTGSAPLSTSHTEERVQTLSQHSDQPKDNFSVLNGTSKSYQADNVEAAVKETVNQVIGVETNSPVQPVLAVHEVIKAGQARASQEDIPMLEEGAGQLIQHLHLPQKKAINGGETASVQSRKQGENEYFVWVNGRRYQKLKKIGRGGSSEVFKVIDRDGSIYALKRIKLKGRDYGTACGFYQEIELLTRLQGKSYIIHLIDHEVTDKNLFSTELDSSHIIRHDAHIYMVLEYGEVDLATMLQDKLKERQPGDNVDETWLRFYWRQILEAVNTVHEERIIHADLKPANFLLVKGVLKLIDFGIAKSIQGDTTNIERDAQVGTLNYMSPEAFVMNELDEHGNVIKCGRPSDIWALGCILYQMVYGKTPFAHITALHAKIREVANPNHKIDFKPVSNPHLLDIMKKCLAYKRQERLRIPELLNHPFLQPQMAYPEFSKKVETEILSQIQAEEQEGRDVQALARLLEKVRLLGGC